MLNKKPLTNIVFLDIETTSQYPRFEDMPAHKKLLFLKRFKEDFKKLKDDLMEPDDALVIEKLYDNKAPLFAEFGKIICISGLRIMDSESLKYKTVSIVNESEEQLLLDFLKTFKSIAECADPAKGKDYICAHNGLMFDFPYMSKRMIANGIPLPAMFDFAESKPWELAHFIDTKAVWKFGSYDNNTSLELLCDALNVETPKDDMTGDKVKDAYWIKKDINGIAAYCEKDVVALANCYVKMKGINKQLTNK